MKKLLVAGLVGILSLSQVYAKDDSKEETKLEAVEELTDRELYEANKYDELEERIRARLNENKNIKSRGGALNVLRLARLGLMRKDFNRAEEDYLHVSNHYKGKNKDIFCSAELGYVITRIFHLHPKSKAILIKGSKMALGNDGCIEKNYKYFYNLDLLFGKKKKK